MKKYIGVFGLMACIFTITSCALLGGAAVMQASSEINQSVLSVENENFQQEYGIELIIVKRGLWSMQSTFKNSMIELYYRSLLDNRLVFSFDSIRREFAQQRIIDDMISIVINGQFQNFTEYEKEILIIASTSTLALLRDTNFKQDEIPNMFFRFIDEYDKTDIPNIISAQWFRGKNIIIANDGIIIG
jgi:hypothetical protein